MIVYGIKTCDTVKKAMKALEAAARRQFCATFGPSR